MIPRLVTAAGICALLGACGSKPPPRPANVKATPAAAVAPTGAGSTSAPAESEWSYSSVGRRDPFRSYLSEMVNSKAGLATRCATPLGKFELEQLKLVAVVTGLEDPVAMLEAPSGAGYSVRRGACVGKNGGTVAAVRSGEVVVSEWALRADGTRDRTQTVLRLPREAALNLEE